MGVNREDRRTRRNNGKSDTIDAEAAARSVRAGQSKAIPKTADGHSEMIRHITIARDTAVKARTAAIITLKAIVVKRLRRTARANGRHRLYRGGHRQANAALHRSAIVRMRFHQRTIDYVARRTTEGMPKREIIRCVNRYLAREIYQRVMTDHRTRPSG